MANLTGTKIANTYKQLLQIGSNNNGISGTVQTVQDGSGTSSPLQLSNSAVNINGTFQLSGVTLTANASTLNAVADLTGATGIVAVSAGNVYGRTITGGTGVSITNGDGTEGNPTIALNTTGVVSGTYGPLTNLEINAVGQVVSATAVSTSVSVPTIRASEFIGGTFKGTTADFSSNTSIGGSIVVENTAVFNSTVSVSGTLTGSTATFTGTVSAGNISGANATFSGNVSATEYYGDGSNLTGIVAASATFATSAGFAASATNASFALSATNANFAASASFASSASYAASAGEASFAVSASSAAFATSADSATFAVSATNATTAYNVSGGIADISGLTAVSASISDLRAFQIGATSVSIGYLNVNAITAITISATDLKSSTLSFTSVSVSSLRVYRLAVETTLSATYGTFTGNVSAVSFYGDGSNLTGILVSIPTSVPSYTVNQLTIVSAATLAGVDLDTRINTVSVNTSVNAAAITSINTILGDGSNFATSAELAATSAALATSISNHLPLSGGTLTGTVSGTDASFSGNVSASFFYGDGSNLTNLPSAPTSVSAYTVNQLTIVSAATLAGTDLETRINTVSVNTSVNSAAITSINTVINNLDYATSAELATVSSALATSIGNSNTNITTNTNAITSINTILGDGSNFATSAELAATSAALATSIATANTRITSVSDYAVALSATLATSISNSNTNIATVSALTSVNSAAITSINTVVANVSSTLATSIANHLPLAGGTLTGTVSGTDASFSGNVSASLFYGDGSNLTNLPSAPTSVTSFTVNQLTAVSTTSLMGITYPTTDGTSGQVLQTNGAGALTFVSVAAGGATDIDGLSDAITNSSGATIGLGTGALANDDGTTNNNTALGYNALNDITSGANNVGIGYGAGQTLTTAQESVYIGRLAGGNADTNARNNVCIGNQAGYGTSSQYSVYIGDLSGQNGSGDYNVAVGRYTLYASGTGGSNTAVGYIAGFSITDGTNNSLFGRDSGRSITTGSNNNTFGYLSGYNITTGQSNVVIGSEAGENISTGSYNVFIGQEAGESQAGNKLTGNDNVAVGRLALTNMRGSNQKNTAIGAYALEAFGFDADNNTAVGYGAGNSISTGDNNTCIGYDAEPSSGTASNEVTLGNASITKFRIPGIDFVLKDNGGTPTTGQVLTADGSGEGYWATPPAGGATDIDGLSDAVTYNSGQSIGIGANALDSEDGGLYRKNTAVGYDALTAVTTGQYNVALGYQAGKTFASSNYNTAIGTWALQNYAGTGNGNNTAVGYSAGNNNTSSTGNTHVGSSAGYSTTTGSNNVFIGYNAAQGVGATTTGSNQIVIGSGSTASLATVSNEITLGNASISTLRCNQTTISSLSDRRDKTDIEDLPIGLDFIKSLRPVKFRWDRRDGTMANVKDAGFIAQELDEVQQDFNSEEYMKMVLKTNPEKLEAAPGKLIPVLVKAIQELSQEVERLKEGK